VILDSGQFALGVEDGFSWAMYILSVFWKTPQPACLLHQVLPYHPALIMKPGILT
jgi:hypothetical protein